MDLGGTKGDKNDYSSPKLTHLQNILIMRIVGTPEKYLSRGELKSVTSKVYLASVDS